MQRTWTRWLTRALSVALCAALPSVAAAQTGKLTGVVTDVQSGAPLDGAQIFLQGTGLGTLTAENGRFFLLNVPIGTFTVVARRIGYQTAERTNVRVLIDVTTAVNFGLNPTPQVVEEVVVTAAATPLIQPGMTGSQTAITASEIEALPVTSIEGVLQLQQGYFQVPDNTDIVSFYESRRNPVSAVRIRGGRAGETVTLIDQIPINNFVFGGPAFSITKEAIEQVDYQRGGFEPQYGNALSGVINQATREGGTELSGALSYQTSAVGGALGSRSDELLGYSQLEGYLSGPVPGSGERLRFVVAGRNVNERDRVLEFDDDVYNYTTPSTNPNNPHPLDLFPGWRAFGFNSIRDLMGKLSLRVTPTAKLNLMGITYQRQRLPFDFDYLLTGFSPLSAPSIRTLTDTLAAIGGSVGNPQGLIRYTDIVQGSILADRTLWSVRWDHTVGRWVYKLAFGRFDQERQTCNFFQGVCLGNRFADINFTGRFVAPGISTFHPAGGTDQLYGGERLRTTVYRGDVQAQVTDHHNVQFGAFYQKHRLDYREFNNLGVNDVFVVPQFYSAQPWEAALYFQDRIEYEFLTIKLGVRYDYGKAGGLFFTDPRNPINGTSAREVCNADSIAVARGLSDGTPFRFVDSSTTPFTTYTGFAACTKSGSLLDRAAVLAAGDDFSEASVRRQFSPRIGVSFPLSERSSVFFNFGRYAQNPLYNNVFQQTGVGTDSVMDGTQVCSGRRVRPGTNDCQPIVFADAYQVSFLGNPNLLIEGTTSYEAGYATEIGSDYALSVILFNKDQYGLTGVRDGGVDTLGNRVFDVGTTYGQGLLNYDVLVNQDFQTVRGFEVQLRRRLANYWGFNINYSYSQSTTNAAPPDRELEARQEGDPQARQEITSEIDQPHVFKAALNFRVGAQAPTIPLGSLLRNFNASVTLRAGSGLPYTPTVDFTGTNGADRNTGREPSTWVVDLQASKEWQIGNLRYGGFVRVENLFDTRNCVQVFTTTGRCDAGVVDQSRARQGNSVTTETVSTYFDRAHYFDTRRTINAGLRMSF